MCAHVCMNKRKSKSNDKREKKETKRVKAIIREKRKK